MGKKNIVSMIVTFASVSIILANILFVIYICNFPIVQKAMAKDTLTDQMLLDRMSGYKDEQSAFLALEYLHKVPENILSDWYNSGGSITFYSFDEYPKQHKKVNKNLIGFYEVAQNDMHTCLTDPRYVLHSTIDIIENDEVIRTSICHEIGHYYALAEYGKIDYMLPDYENARATIAYCEGQWGYAASMPGEYFAELFQACCVHPDKACDTLDGQRMYVLMNCYNKKL